MFFDSRQCCQDISSSQLIDSLKPKIHHPEGYEPIKKIPADSFRISHEFQARYIRGNPGLDIS